MSKNLYNDNEGEFSEVVEILKNLPKINAPDNFEFNLNTRIQNKAFDINETSQTSKWLTWGLGPVAAIVVSTIVFFMVVSDVNVSNDNIVVKGTGLMQTTQNSVTNDSKNLFQRISKSEAVINNKLHAVIKPNDVVVKNTNPFPFNTNNSVNLDDYINGAGIANSGNGNLHIVNSNQGNVNFNGFGIPIKTDPKQLAAMRNRIDSLYAKKIKK